MRNRNRKQRRATTAFWSDGVDASTVVAAMAKYGVAFTFSPGGTLRIANAAACPTEIWNLFLAGDQAQLCAAVRQLLTEKRDPLGPLNH